MMEGILVLFAYNKVPAKLRVEGLCHGDASRMAETRTTLPGLHCMLQFNDIHSKEPSIYACDAKWSSLYSGKDH